MTEKYDNQVYTKVRDSLSYIEYIPAAVVDLEKNYIVFANTMFEDVFKLKKTPASFGEISACDVSGFVREIETLQDNLISTNTEFVKLNSTEGDKINADIKLKLVDKSKPNLVLMALNLKNDHNTGDGSLKLWQNAVNEDNSAFIKIITDALPLLAYVYDIETREIIYLNDYTTEFFKGFSNSKTAKKLDIHTELSPSEDNVLIYEKSISGVWFKMTEVKGIWENGRNVKICLGVNITEEKREEKKISAGSVTDELTGTYNKIVGYNRLQECIKRVEEEGGIFSLCYIDIDKIGYVNQNFGLREGDRYIKNVVSTVKKIIRRSDVFSRIGGDEFIIVLCDCPILTAERIMKSINSRLEEINIEENQLYDYSISYGIVEVNKNMELKLDKLVENAENEMCRYRFSENK